MTVQNVTRMWSRFGGSDTTDDGVTATLSLRGAYDVLHDVDTPVASILGHADIPQLGEAYSDQGTPYPGVVCRSRVPEQASLYRTVVNVEWEGTYGASGLADNPLNAEPDIDRSNNLVNVEVDQDFNGIPITNSVGDPVDGVTTEISDFSISIRRNFESIDIYALREYLRSHNSDTFDGWPPGTARFRKYRAREKRFQGQIYHEVTAVIEFREPYNTVPAHAWYARYRNEGFRERVGTNVTFSGGGGSGAAAYAVTNSSGGITKIVVTNQGQGYTSAPTVNITSETGGTGASATANLTNDRVTSVTVGAAGTDYKSKLVRATDDDKEPVTSPVLLAADGSRLTDAAAAVWIERPLSGGLPYNTLGLLD